ncbi:inosine-uridine preferring nucleoside hydrolase [Nannizzia gypsea CBS 118893]|uniref:Inosine-uridine preferring nucleoside hydrolase n=1 Tax=Arthroderma gypseum (strain ATCC MYA-4604 / CBS 118893) TaxID=535722 RepID=E4UTT9_ARTGP|nr:inosine-uridine preferring nucleoside hydrolase [Nannizzia gypsea CBS 118893]EFR01582.1 inosine-uridine preferring nucleoside hydrolase [Nannizzia gypsea CBS 118893]
MPKRIIIDTDPGVDDILALLLAFSASSAELEVLLVSLTFGNIEIKKCLHNAVSLFHVIEKELAHRGEAGEHTFSALKACRPILACGAEGPLDGSKVDAGYFHGHDGLGNVHTKCPHLSADDTYQALFSGQEAADEEKEKLFIPSRQPSHLEMLRLLRENEEDSITIVAVGPLTNLALAAAEDLPTFLRAKEVVIMGGAIDEPGNVTPFAEFNVFADPLAAAQLFALTSLNPRRTWPTSSPMPCPTLPGKKRLTLKMAPLDLTHAHNFTPTAFREAITAHLQRNSPLAELISTVVEHTFSTISGLKLARREATTAEEEMSLHDPVCVWYVLTSDEGWTWRERDVRVETVAQWTRGATVVDRRIVGRIDTDVVDKVVVEEDDAGVEVEVEVEAEEREDDRGGWRAGGNRVGVLERGPGSLLSEEILQRVFA